MFNNIDFNDIAKVMDQVKNNVGANSNDNKKVFEAQSGGGLVKVSMNGGFEIIDINIDNSLLDDKESLEILVMSSLNEVIKMIISDKSSMVNDLMQGFMSNKNN